MRREAPPHHDASGPHEKVASAVTRPHKEGPKDAARSEEPPRRTPSRPPRRTKKDTKKDGTSCETGREGETETEERERERLG